MAFPQTKFLIAVAAAGLSLSPEGVMAATCQQEKAIYGDSNGAYELRFRPVGSDAAAATHRFSVKVIGSGLMLDGYVLGSEPVNRSNGVLLNHCPEGDVTGADLAACTVWQGVIYASLPGRMGLLPAGAEEAPPAILLSDFGPALRQSSAWGEGKATVVPWDMFTLKGCAA